MLNKFWAWYERHYLLNLSISTFLFAVQLFHLYWLFTDVVLLRLTGQSYFAFPDIWGVVSTFLDYSEIPAIISTSILYLHFLRKKFTYGAAAKQHLQVQQAESAEALSDFAKATSDPPSIISKIKQKFAKADKNFFYLLFINIQWVHILWITDEIVVERFTNAELLYWPAALAWIAIVIDYLELPVIVDTAGKLYKEISTRLK